jgi:hypothetical protein
VYTYRCELDYVLSAPKKNYVSFIQYYLSRVNKLWQNLQDRITVCSRLSFIKFIQIPVKWRETGLISQQNKQVYFIDLEVVNVMGEEGVAKNIRPPSSGSSEATELIIFKLWRDEVGWRGKRLVVRWTQSI